MENELAPKFFIPLATPDNEESIYAKFAEMCHITLSDQNRRVYSITYIHNGEEWTATVGQPLRGVRHKITRSKGKKLQHTSQLSDPAIVLAIFDNTPFFVVTNQYLAGNIRSAWENPFMAGDPLRVKYFST